MGFKPRFSRNHRREDQRQMWVRRNKKTRLFMKSEYPYMTTNAIGSAQLFQTKVDATGNFWIAEDWEPVRVCVTVEEAV